MGVNLTMKKIVFLLIILLKRKEGEVILRDLEIGILIQPLNLRRISLGSSALDVTSMVTLVEIVQQDPSIKLLLQMLKMLLIENRVKIQRASYLFLLFEVKFLLIVILG